MGEIFLFTYDKTTLKRSGGWTFPVGPEIKSSPWWGECETERSGEGLVCSARTVYHPRGFEKLTHNLFGSSVLLPNVSVCTVGLYS